MSLNCQRGSFLLQHFILTYMSLWVRFKAQKIDFAVLFYSKVPKTPVSLVLAQCKVKKGSSIFAKLTMSLTPAGLLLHFVDLPLIQAPHKGRHRKPWLVLP